LYENIVELLERCKRVRYKWIFKIKRDSHDNIKSYKVWLVIKIYLKK